MRRIICAILIISMGNSFTMYGNFYTHKAIGSERNMDPIRNIDSVDFTVALKYVDSFQTYSFKVLYKGQTVCEKYFRNYIRYDLINSYSMAKSYMSAILGIAINENKISLDDKVSDYVQPPFSGSGINAVTELKVRHLATMTSGLDYNWHRDYVKMRDQDSWLEFIQTMTIKYPPGTKWEYSVDPDLLSAVLQKAVGKPLWEYAEEKLLIPIGVMDGFYWARDASGMLLGDGYIFSTTENYARFGQLFLDNGKVNGRQVIPEEWVRLSTSSAGINADYGYLWWTKDFEGLPQDLYYAYGGHGQFIVIIPSRETVIIRTGHGPNDPITEFLPTMIRKVLNDMDQKKQ